MAVNLGNMMNSVTNGIKNGASNLINGNTREEIFKSICKTIPGAVNNDAILKAFEAMRLAQKALKKDFTKNKSINDNAIKNHEATIKKNKGFVEDQNKYTDMPYGESTMQYSGCEIFATFNAIYALKKAYPISLPTMIGEYEKDGMVMSGKFGTSPQAICDFFKRHGFTAAITTKEADFDTYGKNYTTWILTMYNDKDDISKEVHTVNISKEGNDLYAHNVYCNGTVVGPAASISQLIGKMNGGKAKGITLIGIK